MAFNWDLLVPYKYANQYVTLRQLETIMLPDYHPESVRRFIGWLHYKNGNVGAGGLSRTEQPTGPTFAASLLVSFHWAGQKYNDGVTAACAVDTVFKDGPDVGDAHDGIRWTEVPAQGSAEAARWGIHANVGSPTGTGVNESWHIQPVEIDGHATWLKAGRPAPVTGYPIPVEHDPYATPPSKDVDMIALDATYTDPDTVLTWDGLFLAWVENGHANQVLVNAQVPRQVVNREQLHGVILASRTTTRPPYTLDAELSGLWETRAL